MGQLDTFDRGPSWFGEPTISTLDRELLTRNDRDYGAEREMEEGAGVDANDGAKSGNQEAEKLLERTLWGLRLWPLTGHN